MTLKDKSADVVPRILDTAAAIFSDVGYAGARMDEIADRAGVNEATIYYLKFSGTSRPATRVPTICHHAVRRKTREYHIYF